MKEIMNYFVVRTTKTEEKEFFIYWGKQKTRGEKFQKTKKAQPEG